MGFDYDLLIVGCGVGGHGAALHAVAHKLKVAVVEAREMGGTCINRGCIPSKALLAASGRLRSLRESEHLGIYVGEVRFEREKIAAHAAGVVDKIRTDLTRSLQKLGATILPGRAQLLAPQQVEIKAPTGEVQTVTARDVLIATGSSPFVPPGIVTDGVTVYTSDEGVRLDRVPERVCIIGSGYIGLEFSDVYTALGARVTMIEALDRLMPGFDPDIARLATKVLIKARNIDTKVGVLAKKVTPGTPATVELASGEVLEFDAVLVATGRVPDTRNLGLEAVGVETHRGFIPVDDRMATSVPHLWAIGDATGKMMLAHAAAAQGVVAVENMLGHERRIDYRAIPAAVFTHPEIGFVGFTEPVAREQGYKVGVVRTYFGGNSKAIAQGETEGMAKLVYDSASGELLGCHIFGPEASLLVAEAAQAIAHRESVERLAHLVHTHPTLSEILDEGYKRAAALF
ncbi:dihydrolipoyl dehydrogenase [Gloeobacter kilaueensis]|uniref:Dihydrolipoyl dehydrogenase n=1 Tax=Gloeobacter kilaueensis (strain ATCC BAA-2537 / CCAP 1431/1 / ULC 316 / JS1) TaxID=1183438 RepID=U5QJD0_GLOK1|nr:dihydrolipoyl dehydrogenase [Gloeobacter kilaueensis]AGY59021.1 dihydrolipoamide dehydrogenase [Gloeobacter kilaueensis JS1]